MGQVQSQVTLRHCQPLSAWQGANESAEAVGARFEEEIGRLLGEA